MLVKLTPSLFTQYHYDKISSFPRTLKPSCSMMFFATKWISRNQDLRAVKAFKQGMSPTVIAMLIASGWLLATANASTLGDWRLWVTTGVAAVLVIDGRVNMFWLLAIGGSLGALGIIS